MKLDLNPLKTTILNETQKDRETIQNIYKQSCQRATKRARIKWIILLLSLYGLFLLLRFIWVQEYPVVAVILGILLYICATPFIGMMLVGDMSLYEESLDEILAKDKAYFPLIEKVNHAKTLMEKENVDLAEYLLWLKDQVLVAVLNENRFSSAKTMKERAEKLAINQEEVEIVTKIESRFEKSVFFFDDTFSNIAFRFIYGYDGEAELGEKAAKEIYVDDEDVENGTITYKAWYRSWF